MHLAAGLLLAPATCIHCSRPTGGAGRCSCAAGIREPPARRFDAAEVLSASLRATA